MYFKIINLKNYETKEKRKKNFFKKFIIILY